MTDSPTSQAMHLAMTELKERAERVAVLEEALREILSIEIMAPEGGHEEVLEIHSIARSVLNKETNRPTPAAAFDFCWLVELRPAFEGHPSFAATYYAGWSESGGDAVKTFDPMAAARFARKEDAERVASNLLHTLSCVWTAVEHGFHRAENDRA